MSDNQQLIGEKSTLRDTTTLSYGYVELDENKTSENQQILNAVSEFEEKPSKSDDMDAAALCQWAYDHYDGKIEYSEYHGWSIVENVSEIFGDRIKLEVKSSGFASLLFSKTINRRKYYAYCTVGTKMTSWADWFTNLSQGLIGLSPQYTRSVQNAKILHDQCIKTNSVLWFIGHSLGGGLASNNSLITGRYAITFDAAGLNILRVKMSMLMNVFYKNRQKYFFNYRERTSKIHAYILRGEILNRVLQCIFQKAYGDKDGRIISPRKEHIREMWTWEKHSLSVFIDEMDIPYKPSIVDYNYYELTTNA